MPPLHTPQKMYQEKQHLKNELFRLFLSLLSHCSLKSDGQDAVYHPPARKQPRLGTPRRQFDSSPVPFSVIFSLLLSVPPRSSSPPTRADSSSPPLLHAPGRYSRLAMAARRSGRHLPSPIVEPTVPSTPITRVSLSSSHLNPRSRTGTTLEAHPDWRRGRKCGQRPWVRQAEQPPARRRGQARGLQARVCKAAATASHAHTAMRVPWPARRADPL